MDLLNLQVSLVIWEMQISLQCGRTRGAEGGNKFSLLRDGEFQCTFVMIPPCYSDADTG